MRDSTDEIHIPRTKSPLGWITFATSFIIQIVVAVWIIASMNAAIVELKAEVNSLIKVQVDQSLELNKHEMDIRLIQQSLPRR